MTGSIGEILVSAITRTGDFRQPSPVELLSAGFCGDLTAATWWLRGPKAAAGHDVPGRCVRVTGCVDRDRRRGFGLSGRRADGHHGRCLKVGLPVLSLNRTGRV